MAAEFSQPLELSRSTQPERRSAAELLAPGANPLLTLAERVYIRGLVRGTSFSAERTPDAVEWRGVSSSSMEKLKALIMDEHGRKKSFHEATNNLNQHPNNDEGEVIRDRNVKLSRALVTLNSGIAGDLSGLMDRVSSGRANCLETIVTLQLIAKVFYPEEIKAAYILPMEDQSPLARVLKTRSYALFTATQDGRGNHYFLTRYTGSAREMDAAGAEERRQQAKTLDAPGVAEFFTGYLKLIEQVERSHS